MHTPLFRCENMTLEQKLHIIHLIGIAGFIFLYAAIECMGIYASCFTKTCLHTLRLTGDQWVQELIDSYNERFYNEMGMHETVFTWLLDLLMREAGLHDTQYVTA